MRHIKYRRNFVDYEVSGDIVHETEFTITIRTTRGTLITIPKPCIRK